MRKQTNEKIAKCIHYTYYHGVCNHWWRRITHSTVLFASYNHQCQSK